MAGKGRKPRAVRQANGSGWLKKVGFVYYPSVTFAPNMMMVGMGHADLVFEVKKE
ncbi:hypothetical protein ACFQ88_11320 [Paenibacillus sp. NPDC056579]|uniref:hypothetical protein n=1 Tax=Paenibacillus sp. NPDC056579 TaxID=3345871 RepID=UPI0036BC32C7